MGKQLLSIETSKNNPRVGEQITVDIFHQVERDNNESGAIKLALSLFFNNNELQLNSIDYPSNSFNNSFEATLQDNNNDDNNEETNTRTAISFQQASLQSPYPDAKTKIATATFTLLENFNGSEVSVNIPSPTAQTYNNAPSEVFETRTLALELGTTTSEISVEDISLEEGNEGNKDFTFTVAITEASTEIITVDFATEDNTAIAGEDYTATNGTLEFAPGETEKTITVQVAGDTQVEGDENFSLKLSNASNATISEATATGVIQNDDIDNTPLELTGGTAQIAYVAYYGRPADNGGLKFWNDVLTDSGISYAPRGGDRLTGSEQETYDRVVNQFGNSDEADRLFGSIEGNRNKINQVYQFAFNRDGDEAGLDFWTEQLDKNNVTLATFALEVALGAQNEDITVLNNKITSADLFSNSIDTEAETSAYSGSTGEVFGRDWLDDFGSTISSQVQVDTALTNLVNSDL